MFFITLAMFFITLATNFRRVALISIFFIYKLPQKWQNELHYLQWGWMTINTSFPPYTFYIKGYLFGVIPDPRYPKNLNWLHNLMIKLSLYFWNSYYCNTAYFSWIFLWKLLLLWNKCQWLYNFDLPMVVPMSTIATVPLTRVPLPMSAVPMIARVPMTHVWLTVTCVTHMWLAITRVTDVAVCIVSHLVSVTVGLAQQLPLLPVTHHLPARRRYRWEKW